MVNLGRISISPPLINGSCAWASELHELEALYNCPFTGAVTTRTATLLGFTEDSVHTVSAIAKTTIGMYQDTIPP
jgi:dihydroorotate dehydrogenase (fumarate)